MKQIASSALFWALLGLVGTAAAATVSLGDTTSGQPAIKAHTDVAVAIPLDNPASYAGTVASISGSQLTLSGTPGFTGGQFVTSPFIVKFENGARSGLQGLITSNGANTLTISIPAGDNLSGASGSSITIRPAWTLSRLMGTSMPAGTQVIGFSGNVPGINLSPDLAYEFDGTNWWDLITFDTADAAVLYTGKGFIVRNTTSTPINSFVVSGEVPTSASRVVLSKKLSARSQDNWISYVSAVDEPIGSSGLGAIANIGDEVLAFDNSLPGYNKSASSIAMWDGQHWIDSATFENVSQTFMLNGARAYVIRRDASAPIGNTIWSHVPAYAEFGL